MRGTGRVAVSCRANVRLVAAPAGSTIAERAATARVFVEADKAADGAAQCRTQLGADLAGRLAGVLPSSAGAGAAGDLRAVTVDADVVEPAAIPELVKSLRGIGAVSAAEVTRVAAGRAEIKVRTRAAPAAVAAALSRVAGSVITLSDVQTSGDTIRVRVRVRGAQRRLPEAIHDPEFSPRSAVRRRPVRAVSRCRARTAWAARRSPSASSATFRTRPSGSTTCWSAR